jgi:ABC-type sulfate/molybdate transport systems ATPase subunit
MAPSPNLLLLDEPFNALDEKLKMELHKETKNIFRQKTLTVVIVSHDKQEAQFFSDRIFTIENGEVLQMA